MPFVPKSNMIDRIYENSPETGNPPDINGPNLRNNRSNGSIQNTRKLVNKFERLSYHEDSVCSSYIVPRKSSYQENNKSNYLMGL